MSNNTEEIRSILNQLKESGTSVEDLKNQISEKGLSGKAEKFEKKYKNEINSFINELNSKGELTSEEKAKMIMEMKQKLTPSQQKQFGAVLNALKKYLKK